MIRHVPYRVEGAHGVKDAKEDPCDPSLGQGIGAKRVVEGVEIWVTDENITVEFEFFGFFEIVFQRPEIFIEGVSVKEKCNSEKSFINVVPRARSEASNFPRGEEGVVPRAIRSYSFIVGIIVDMVGISIVNQKKPAMLGSNTYISRMNISVDNASL